MDKQTADLLQQLAAKLGTTAEYIWAVLIRQAYVSFATDLVMYAIWGVALWVTVKRGLPYLKDFPWEEGPEDEYDGVKLVAFGIWLLILGICSLVAIFGIPETITAIANPEYWALKQILETVSGKSGSE